MNTAYSEYPFGVAPLSGRVFCLDDKMSAAAYQSTRNVKITVVPVVTYRCGKKSLSGFQRGVKTLSFGRKRIRNLFPVYKVFAVKDGKPRKKSISGGYHVIISVLPADARVRISTLQYRIENLAVIKARLLKTRVVAGVCKTLKISPVL